MAESWDEVGRRPVTPHTSPKAQINLAFPKSRAGYVFEGRVDQKTWGGRAGRWQTWSILSMNLAWPSSSSLRTFSTRSRLSSARAASSVNIARGGICQARVENVSGVEVQSDEARFCSLALAERMSTASKCVHVPSVRAPRGAEFKTMN